MQIPKKWKDITINKNVANYWFHLCVCNVLLPPAMSYCRLQSLTSACNVLLPPAISYCRLQCLTAACKVLLLSAMSYCLLQCLTAACNVLLLSAMSYCCLQCLTAAWGDNKPTNPSLLFFATKNKKFPDSITKPVIVLETLMWHLCTIA
jgi:hypothetical protein